MISLSFCHSPSSWSAQSQEEALMERRKCRLWSTTSILWNTLPLILCFLLISPVTSSLFLSNRDTIATTHIPSLLRIPSNESNDLTQLGYGNRSARRSVASGGIFTIVSFDNVPCNATTGDVGVCLTNRECESDGGTANGACAGNYGVCCVLTVTCGGTVNTNQTYFVQPGFPTPTGGSLSCSITVNVLKGASQLYLEFIDFQINSPTAGSCTNDSFVVSGVPSTYPVLCGNNVGQSEYIDLKGASTVQLSFNLGANSDQRSWKIRVVLLKSTDSCAAPPGCFQYYQTSSGSIQSFNFNAGQGMFLNNYCVNLCFNTLAGYCSLLLTENQFMLSGMAPSDCMGDYILANGVQFCGDTLDNGMLLVNMTVAAANFISIQICSDMDNADVDLGFSLNYNLMPCAP